MAKFVSVFMSTTHRRLICALAWVMTFAAVLAVAGFYTLHKTVDIAQERTRHGAERFLQLRGDLRTVFDMMDAGLTAEPCTLAFRDQLRRVAYLPDGLNEFLYAPGGKAQCSTRIQNFDKDVDFGAPDIDKSINAGVSLWIDRDLAFLGLHGETGTFALRDPFVAVVPPRAIDPHPLHWLSMELVLVAADGGWFHRAGEAGVYQRQLDNTGSSLLWSGRIGNLTCEPEGVRCVAAEANLAALIGGEKGAVALVLIAAALIAAYASNRIGRLFARRWSFEARFRRHLDASSIVCAYQPLMNLQSGEIAGCEVLARWRDIDDSIVFPDRFIPIVERCDMTLRLTQLIADRACEELSRIAPPGRRMKVSFNIFPRDLDCDRLLEIFAGFIARPERFELVLEIIESDEMPADAQIQIEALRRAGVRTYMDDFGAGYSNMGSLAALSVDGVKLDRSFAMAPDDSMMAQMLHHAIDMIQTTGRIIVIEGVETAERLALLRALPGRIDYVQGYHIARPLDIAGFASFIEPPRPAGEGIEALQARLRRHVQGAKIAV